LEITQSTLASPRGECLDAPLAKLDVGESGLVGEPTGLVQLLGGEVDSVDRACRTDQAGGVEGVHPGSTPEVDHRLTGPQVGEVEEVADPGERLHRVLGDGREPVGVVPGPQRDRRTELAVEPVLRLLGHVPVHVLDLGLEFFGVHRDSHRPHLSGISNGYLDMRLPSMRYCQEKS